MALVVEVRDVRQPAKKLGRDGVMLIPFGDDFSLEICGETVEQRIATAEALRASLESVLLDLYRQHHGLSAED